MRDEHDDRIHQALRGEFASNVAAIIRSTAYAFERLTARLYAEPWAKKERSDCPPRTRATIV